MTKRRHPEHFMQVIKILYAGTDIIIIYKRISISFKM
jgi:hypothetical protein